MNPNKTGRESKKGNDDLGTGLSYITFLLLLGKEIGTGKAKREAIVEEITRLNERLRSFSGYTVDYGLAETFFRIALQVKGLWPEEDSTGQRSCCPPKLPQKGGNDVE